MAAPVTTARVTPTGLKMTDGHPTFIAFAIEPGVQFWEKEAKPPGRDGGEKIDITTFFNTRQRTYAPRALQEGTDSTLKVAYNPAVEEKIMAMVNNPGSITVHYPGNFGTTDFFGYLQKWEPDTFVEGTQPTANVTIVQTDYDPVNGVEQDPVYKTAGGTVVPEGL
jgi:hypothetical protein